MPILEAIQLRKSSPVQIAVQVVEVAGDNPARGQLPDFLRTGGEVFRHAVQNRRGPVGVEEVAGKHVAAEEQVEFPAEESAVADSVAGQMNHLQTAPVRQHLSIGQTFINHRGLVVERRATDRLQPPAPAVDALVGKRAVYVLLLGRVGENFRACPAFQPGEIAGMVEMSVS